MQASWRIVSGRVLVLRCCHVAKFQTMRFYAKHGTGSVRLVRLRVIAFIEVLAQLTVAEVFFAFLQDG